ncbi:YvrJ family protein [Bacillus velezensis]
MYLLIRLESKLDALTQAILELKNKNELGRVRISLGELSLV